MQRIPKSKQAPKAPTEKPKIILPPKPKLTKDWVELVKNVMICSGSYNQAHRRYKGRNYQGSAVCIVACAYANLRRMDTWTKDVLDDILEVGNNLYLKTRQLCEDRTKIVFKPTEIYKYFFLGPVKISMRMGIDTTSDRVPRDTNLIQKIDSLLQDFFSVNMSGIFSCQEAFFAIWKLEKYFYTFDPTEHDPRGGKWMRLPGTGFCYCLRCHSTSYLADILVKNCVWKQINRVVIYPCSVEKYIKINTKPPDSLKDVQPIPLEVTSQLKKPRATTTTHKKSEQPPKKPTEQPPKEPAEQPPKEPAEPPPPPETTVKIISKSRIPPERPKLQSVTNFLQISSGRGILRASTHQRDPKFTKYLGAQSFANSIAALTMLRQYKSKVWIRRIVDDVLRLGEKIHHDLRKLAPGEIVKRVTLNDVDYAPKIERYGAVGRLTSDDDKVLSLEQALQNTLLETDCCIIIGPQVVAAWKEYNRFYMFDPEERDCFGVKVEGQPGVACVTWYDKVRYLVELYLENIHKTSRKDRFMINKVTIEDYVDLAQDWFNFKALTPNKWILRGNFSQQDRRFPPESRNTQCTVNSTMALTYKELKEEKDWDATIVDRVLINGDELYRDCVDFLKETGRFKHRFLMVDEVKRNFNVEDKKVMLEVDDCLVNGILNAKSETGIPNLRRGFEQFFLESDAGIVTANCLSMAVWKKNDTYYYYDSHSRNDKGIVCGYGTACILRMVTIEDLANALLVNLGPDSANLYNISRVVVKLMDVTAEGVAKPPLNSYEAVSDVVSILRASSSHKDAKFNINSGKQEVPMCLAALAFSSVTTSNEWSKDDIDQVLIFGDKLYMESMEANYGDDVPEELNVDDVTTANVKKQMSVGPNVVYFDFDEVAAGTIEENLKIGLDALGERNEGGEEFAGILESQYIIAAMWRDETSYYLFDPRPRDEHGQVYGKDDWSVKIEVPVEDAEEEVLEDQEGVEKVEEDVEEDEEKDEMAGGDNLGEPEEPEKEIKKTEYEAAAIEENVDPVVEETKEEGEEEEEPEDVVVVEKKGSEFWRAKEEEGKACVLRFSRLEDLIGHLMESSPPNQRQDLEFSLKSVRVSNTPVLREIFNPEEEDKEDEIMGDWNGFTEIDYGKWILRSSRCLEDALFPECNRGSQALPMAMVALAFTFLYDLTTFNQQVVDSILSYGDRLYTVARKRAIQEMKSAKDCSLTDEELEFVFRGMTFGIKDFPRKMCMGEKLAKWEVKLEAITGDIGSRIPEIFDVTAGLTTFFEADQFGLLTCRNYSVAVWKTDGFFYMFDPHATGPSGIKSPIGVACITRFKELPHLADTFKKNLGEIGDNLFEVAAFNFQREECVRERHPEEKKQKPEYIGGYNAVTAGKSILRGDVTQDCSKFDRGVHVHSAPIAFVALALSLSKDPETWTRIIIKEILQVGEDLYLDTVEKLGDKFDPWSMRLDVCQVNTDFQIGALKVNSAIRYTEQRGIIDVKNSKVPNLRQGLERFFEENSHGILVTDRFILAIWEQVNGDQVDIFMFDPNSRGGTGLPSQGGVPCVMKFCNAKLAADHVMACMLNIDKTKTEFSVIPVEIVVGTSKTKRKTSKTKDPCVCAPEKSELQQKAPPIKKTLAPCSKPKKPIKPPTLSNKTKRMKEMIPPVVERSIVKKTKELPLSVTGRSSRVQPPLSTKPCAETSKVAALEQKRVLRKIADEERQREESRRCELLGRNGIHDLGNNQAVIRGIRYILPNRELPVNLAAFVFMKISPDLNNWSYKQIELILEAGYQLYVDSFNTYKPDGPKLTLQQVLRRILLKDFEAKIDIRKPILGGTFTKENLLVHLNNFFMVSPFCIVCYKDYLVSVIFKSGYYYLFDPYSRDINGNKAEKGSAVLMRFGDLADMVEKIVKNLRDPSDNAEKRYGLLVVGLSGVQRLA